jgi:hypothetical protein
MAMLKLYEWDDVYEELQKERIEKAICNLEKLICDELDIDIDHYILEPLGAITIGDSLRSRIYD